jgi:hypothetical protein
MHNSLTTVCNISEGLIQLLYVLRDCQVRCAWNNVDDITFNITFTLDITPYITVLYDVTAYEIVIPILSAKRNSYLICRTFNFCCHSWHITFPSILSSFLSHTSHFVLQVKGVWINNSKNALLIHKIKIFQLFKTFF